MNKITILAVREENNLLVIDKKQYPDIDLINFPIVKDRLSYLSNSFALLHAIGASPAKYVEHAFQKAEKIIDGHYFLLNPLAQIGEEIWINLLYQFNEMDKTKCTVISSANDMTLGLYIPEKIIQDFSKRYLLRFLSFVSATLDLSLIKAIFNDAKMIFICENVNLLASTEFHTDIQNLTIYKLTTSHYLQTLLTNPIQKYMAVMPYHAGDVLFLCLALNESIHPFNALLVNEAYTDIVNKILPEITLHTITSDPIKRGKNKGYTRHQNIESLYFLDVIYPSIPMNAVFQYLRPSRKCYDAKIHFIDQWKTSVSNHDYPLVPLLAQPSKSQLTKQKPVEKSIFIHFDAGWHMKIYSLEYQKILIKLLNKAGFRITVLAENNLKLDVDHYMNYATVDKLEQTIKSHAIFLGMDSFPNHYATHVLNHPSITLFSSTRVENADAPSSDTHKDLHNSLSCSPCHAQTICPKYRLDFCKNFVNPEIVFDTIVEMYDTLYSI